MKQLKPVRSDSLGRQVSESIKDAIFAGRFEPGEALAELGLAELYGVSQATVREALVQLEQAGLVVRTRNRRTTVTTFTGKEVRDRLEMRVVLEELAFVRAAPNLGAAELTKLASLAQAIDRAAARGNYHEMTLADLAFHQYVWEWAASPVLYRTLEQLTTPLFAFLCVMREKGTAGLGQPRSHDELIEALAGGVPQSIRAAIRAHIEGSYGSFDARPTMAMGVN